jgi:outer membrane immunogenic protein
VMKKFLLGTVGLIGMSAMAISAPAFAADLAPQGYSKAPVFVAPVYDWSGAYIGVNGGWGSAHDCWDFTTPGGAFIAAEGCHNGSGAVAGGQLGYRWQSNAMVFGIEAQGDWADLKGSNVSLAFPPFTNKSGINAFGLFTGQIGYAWDNVLLYGKGGAAITNNTASVFSNTPVAFAGGTGDQTRWGGVIGAGLDYGFATNWSLGVEYDHLFMGTRSATFTDPTGAFFGTDNIRQDVDLVTVHVNYRWGGPAIAKY